MADANATIRSIEDITIPLEEELDTKDSAEIRDIMSTQLSQAKELVQDEIRKRTAAETQAVNLTARIGPLKPAEPKSKLSEDDRKKVSGIKIEKFRGPQHESWSAWRQLFMTIKDINGWSDAVAIRMAFAAMTHDARLATQHIKPEDYATCKALLDAYQILFEPPESHEVSRMLFDRITQRPNETVLEYSNRLRQAYMRAYPDERHTVSTQLIRKFMYGLVSDRVRTQCFRKKPITYDEVITEAMGESAILHTENINSVNKEKRYVLPAETFSGVSTEFPTVMNGTVGAIGRKPFQPRKRTQGQNNQNGQKSYCSFHKVTTHNTEDCRAKKHPNPKPKFESRKRGKKGQVNSIQSVESEASSDENDDEEWSNEAHDDRDYKNKKGRRGCMMLRRGTVTTRSMANAKTNHLSNHAGTAALDQADNSFGSGIRVFPSPCLQHGGKVFQLDDTNCVHVDHLNRLTIDRGLCTLTKLKSSLDHRFNFVEALLIELEQYYVGSDTPREKRPLPCKIHSLISEDFVLGRPRRKYRVTVVVSHIVTIKEFNEVHAVLTINHANRKAIDQYMASKVPGGHVFALDDMSKIMSNSIGAKDPRVFDRNVVTDNRARKLSLDLKTVAPLWHHYQEACEMFSTIIQGPQLYSVYYGSKTGVMRQPTGKAPVPLPKALGGNPDRLYLLKNEQLAFAPELMTRYMQPFTHMVACKKCTAAMGELTLQHAIDTASDEDWAKLRPPGSRALVRQVVWPNNPIHENHESRTQPPQQGPTVERPVEPQQRRWPTYRLMNMGRRLSNWTAIARLKRIMWPYSLSQLCPPYVWDSIGVVPVKQHHTTYWWLGVVAAMWILTRMATTQSVTVNL